jgi:hypothetical protein
VWWRSGAILFKGVIDWIHCGKHWISMLELLNAKKLYLVLP